jgi:serine/threonine protein kinase
MGPVHETYIKGHAFAWKRRFCRKQIGEVERKEIEILKKLSHTHIIQLIGTYTWRQFLGLLLYPVAVCDLHTLFEDFEAISSNQTLDPAQKVRMSGLGLPSEDFASWRRVSWRFLVSKMGCMTSAVEYLHSQEVRHKDLKPANILLSKDRLWLTDFGSATDFSMLSMSLTENGERGTPKYFAPEVAAFQPSGRSADIFSLGCVLLEIFILTERGGSLQALKDIRSSPDFSYQANLDKTQEFLSQLTYGPSPRKRHLATEIRQMLSRDAQSRPVASEIRRVLSTIDLLKKNDASLFGKCCQTSPIPITEHKAQMDTQEQRFLTQIDRFQDEYEDEINQLQQKLDALKAVIDDREARYGADIRTWRKEYLNSDEKSTLVVDEGGAQNSIRRKSTVPTLRAGKQVLGDERSFRRRETISRETTPNSDEDYRLRAQREFERIGRAIPRDRTYDDVRKDRESQRRDPRTIYIQEERALDEYEPPVTTYLGYHCHICDNIYQTSSHLRQHMRKRHETEARGARHSTENMRKKQSAEAMRRRHSSNLLRRSSSQRIIGD